MPITMDVHAGGDSTPDTYKQGGFAVSTGQAPSLPGQTPDGLTIANDGDGHGDYLLPTYSNAEVFLESVSGRPFGLLSIDLDGFVNSNTGGGIRSQSAPVTFTFIGINPNLLSPVIFTFTTNSTTDFQTVALPAGFASGLVQVSWTVSGAAPNAWGAFDNLVLASNTAPTATGIQGATSVQANGALTGQLGGQDADHDPLSFQLVNPVAGVSVAANGTFYVARQQADDDLLPGQTRQVSFDYRVSDGSESSAVKTVTVTVAAPPRGDDICGTRRADVLNGTYKSESLWGGDGNDKLYGMGGADKLYGDDGDDYLSGGAGHDWLWGCDGRDTLEGGAGNDTLVGGSDNDLFVFGKGFGDDVLVDFHSGHWEYERSWRGGSWEWEGGDVIKFNPSVFGSYGDVMAHAVQTWYGVVITAPDGSTLTLLGELKSHLNAEDFLFG